MVNRIVRENKPNISSPLKGGGLRWG